MTPSLSAALADAEVVHAASAIDAAVATIADALAPEPEPELEPAPGFCVMSTSCLPSGTGPPGLAGHDPGGLTGCERPKGIVPGAPTWRLPEAATNVVGFVLWNWHWKRPLSSAFLGAF